MAMVGVVSGSLYRRTRSLSCLAWSWVGGCLAPLYIHQMNRVNSRNGSATMTAPDYRDYYYYYYHTRSNSIQTRSHRAASVQQLSFLSDFVLNLCGPSWGQPAWQGLGFSRLVHEETHPCGPNFVQSVFETVQPGCINSVLLVQTVPSVNYSIWEEIFPNICVKTYFANFLTIAT